MSIARSLVIIIAGLAIVIDVVACRETPPPVAPALRLSLEHPAELVVGGGAGYAFGLSLAPDGSRLVFPAARGDAIRLWLRDLRRDEIRALPHTENALLPFWSADGRTIGFFSGGQLLAFDVATEAVRVLTDASNAQGGTWLSNGDIIFAASTQAGDVLLRRTPEGNVAPLTTLAAGEVSHRLPQMLGQDHVIFFVRATESTRQGIWIAPLDQPQLRKRLVNSEANGLAVDDAIVYSSGGALVAQAVDLETLSLAAKPQLLGSRAGHGSENQLFATSGGGVVIYGEPASGLRTLRWVDRTGTPIRALGEPMHAWDVRLSPDGTRTAVARIDRQLGTLDIWAYEGQQPVPRRLSPAIHVDESPAWSRDGSRIAWVSGRRTLTVRDADGKGSESALQKFEHNISVTDWSRDGQWVVVTASRPGSGDDILVVRVRQSGESRAYVHSPFNEQFGAIAPDGRWLAYVSDESGSPEVYVDAFPTPGHRSRVSVGGGTEPRWSRDSSQIFFRRGSQIHVARVESAGGTLQAISSETLFDTGAEIRSFDVAPDGQHFLLNLPAPDATPKPLTVLVNWRPEPNP